MITKEQIEGMKANARDFAIWAVDGVHGYTCEHSTNPQGHIDEYDKHEKDFLALCDLALLAVALKPRPLAEIEEAALVVFEDATHTLYKYADGTWRSNLISGKWPADTLAIPLGALAALMEGK